MIDQLLEKYINESNTIIGGIFGRDLEPILKELGYKYNYNSIRKTYIITDPMSSKDLESLINILKKDRRLDLSNFSVQTNRGTFTIQDFK